jgi:hypothetical protein
VNYIIVNNSTFDDFTHKVSLIRAQGLTFTTDYVEKVEKPVTATGGWGCLRFIEALPTQQLFFSPDLEYRYSIAQQMWLADGKKTINSDWVEALHQYFVTLEGQGQ